MSRIFTDHLARKNPYCLYLAVHFWVFRALIFWSRLEQTAGESEFLVQFDVAWLHSCAVALRDEGPRGWTACIIFLAAGLSAVAGIEVALSHIWPITSVDVNLTTLGWFVTFSAVCKRIDWRFFMLFESDRGSHLRGTLYSPLNRSDHSFNVSTILACSIFFVFSSVPCVL